MLIFLLKLVIFGYILTKTTDMCACGSNKKRTSPRINAGGKQSTAIPVKPANTATSTSIRRLYPNKVYR